jgi:regulator of sirC expression with transglutaminase-like and TPR domain
VFRSRDEIRDRLGHLVEDQQVDLAELALLVSAHGQPDVVDVEAELHVYDAMAQELPVGSSLDDLIEVMFGELNFSGDVSDYYSADNSRIEVVVARRTGIPLTLAVVLCSIGRRVGIDLAPVGLPGHVIVSSGDGSRFVDVFDKGRSLTRADCASIISTLHPGVELTASMLAPMSPKAVVVRMLNNLIGAHQRSGSRDALFCALNLREHLHATPTAGAREIAAALAAEGKLAEAALELERAAESTDEPTTSRLLAQATRYRAKLN